MTIQNQILDAMVVWEGILELPAAEREWWMNKYGAREARRVTLEIAPLCTLAYENAVKRGYEECYDWEWVPCWLEAVQQLCIGHAARGWPLTSPIDVASRVNEIAEQLWPSQEAA